MFQEKKMAASCPVNFASEKDRLVKELGRAEGKGEYGEVEKLQSRLKELEMYASQTKSKDAKMMEEAEINRRNSDDDGANSGDDNPAQLAPSQSVPPPDSLLPARV